MLGTIILVILILVVAVFVALCAVGRIPRNTVVGLRMPSFFTSEDAWMLGHRAAIAPVVVTAILGFAVVILVGLLPALGDAAGTLINCALLMTGVIWGSLRGSRAIRRET